MTRRRWRPPLGTILILIHLVILALPLGGIAVLRVYESALIRQTESELIAQGVFVSAAYRTVFDRIARSQRASRVSEYGIARSHVEGQTDPAGPWRPRLVRLDLAQDPVLPAPPAPDPTSLAPDPLAASVGRELEPVLRDAQVTTLAGMRVIDYRGVIVATTGGDLGRSMLNHEEARRALTGEYVSLMRRRGQQSPPPPLDSISRGARIRVAVAVPILHHGRVLGAVTLLRTPANIQHAIRGKRRELAWGGATLLMIVVGLSVFTAVTIGRPVRALIDQARRAARGEANAVTPLRHAGTREIAELSETVAAMARTLEERARYIRDFAAHVSHEFKTPLTAIRGTVELMRDHGAEMDGAERERFLALLESDAERLERLVRRLLELARADMAIAESSDARTELAPLLEALAHRYRERGLKVSVEMSESPSMASRLGGETLDSILSSLLDNVRQHAGNGANATLRARHERGELIIEVADDGAGMSAHNAARVFEPFFTTARGAGNTGLGLSIVRSLLQAHGGRIELAAAASGTCFQIRLPAAVAR
ncbi:MAG: sensor histidine kinase [Panacagrimonas sp.]|nr:HAMP domain-containing sensor histidine kinase [Panacagrimonas sp.]MCC2659046.1 sensor histidine kinase [Panacagrimonas sp.]